MALIPLCSSGQSQLKDSGERPAPVTPKARSWTLALCSLQVLLARAWLPVLTLPSFDSDTQRGLGLLSVPSSAKHVIPQECLTYGTLARRGGGFSDIPPDTPD